MLATLPMYDWPEVRDATDAIWEAIADELGVKNDLDRQIDYKTSWLRPDLLFSQTCGYPLTHKLRQRINYVATPCYEVNGCVGARYCSIIFAREDKPLAEFKDCRAAFNSPDSMSGMLALKLVVAPFGKSFFGSEIFSGGHVSSMQLVAAGDADICAIDAVCVALARCYRPHLLKGLFEVARSPLVPSLPFVTQQSNVEQLRHALSNVLQNPNMKSACQKLFMNKAEVLELSAYDEILELENSLAKCDRE